MNTGYYPEDCDTTGSECLQCVRRTAEAITALMGTPTAKSASGIFQRMYSHGACRQMEHSFVWACGVEPAAALIGVGNLVQIAAVVVAA